MNLEIFVWGSSSGGQEKDVVVELFFFSERLRLVSLFLLNLHFQPLKTNDYPLIINGWFR